MENTPITDSSIKSLSNSQVKTLEEFINSKAFIALKTLFEKRQERLKEFAILKSVPSDNPYLDNYRNGLRAGHYDSNRYLVGLADAIKKEIERRNKTNQN